MEQCLLNSCLMNNYESLMKVTNEISLNILVHIILGIKFVSELILTDSIILLQSIAIFSIFYLIVKPFGLL